MVVEEFCMRKQLTETLQSFRKEWTRPDERISLMSWYEVALKLRLPEIISQHSADITVLENLVSALVRESSIRTRRKPEVVVEGLATLPRNISLPSLVPDISLILNETPLVITTSDIGTEASQKQRRPKSGNNSGSAVKLPSNLQQIPPPIIVKRPIDINMNRANKTSVENWIPEVHRMKSLNRDLFILKENVNDIIMREVSVKRETKQFLRSDLQRATDEMSLDMTKKIPCGCCLQPYLYVNLPLKVSQKAIVDIRVKWSGGLNSSTVFKGIQSLDPDLNPFFTQSKERGKRVGGGSQDDFSDRRVPISRVYEEVCVCVFCSQFFQDQEAYRPSYLQITNEEKRAAQQELKRRELEYWDPLKMCEKDRHQAAVLQAQQEQEAVNKLALTTTTTMTNGNSSNLNNPTGGEESGGGAVGGANSGEHADSGPPTSEGGSND